MRSASRPGCSDRTNCPGASWRSTARPGRCGTTWRATAEWRWTATYGLEVRPTNLTAREQELYRKRLKTQLVTAGILLSPCEYCRAKFARSQTEIQNMKNRILVAMLSLAAFSATGCIGFERESSLTGPSAAGNGALMGNWTSSNLIPAPSSCTDFKWNATEQTGTSAR